MVMTGIYDRISGNEITLTHPGRNRPTQHKLAAAYRITLDGAELSPRGLVAGDEVELVGDPVTEIRVVRQVQR